MLRFPALTPTTETSSPGAIVQDRRGPDASVAVIAALGLLRVYKLLVSPFFAGSCRFEPSCSAYMAESIRVYGVVSGTWRGVKRLSRCRPFGGHGFDPVPRP